MTSRLRDELKEKVAQTKPEERHILLCGGVPCRSLRCLEVKEAVSDELHKHNFEEKVKVLETGCIGNCKLGPSLIIFPEGVVYRRLKTENAREIIEEHVLGGRLLEHLLHRDSISDELQHRREDMPFFQRQRRLVLKNCGMISPGINSYLSNQGYAALAKALTELTPEEVIAEVSRSGLRGRGGGGFPTGRKWQAARDTPGAEKYVICNGDEGDPGAFMDRSIMEGDPHSVLEGLILAAYAVGAGQGYIYVRAEYPLAVQRLERAIGEARKSHFLGDNILEQEFSFDLEIRVGAGAFVCGEETALITSVEGSRGDPNPRPPFPVQKGVWGCPTVINNVETLANIPAIVLNGAAWFAETGTEKSKGTKVFALAGKVRHTGLVEVPMGTTLREIIFDIGGGIPAGKKFKAAQTGGPSGGCLTEEHLDLPLDYDSLKAVGSIIGSGGLIIMDEDSCMVDVARYFCDFNRQESCGKCTPCRIGNKRMLEILEKIISGQGEEKDLQRLEDLALLIKNASLCGLGRSAPNPVLSTMRHFRDEYLAHIKDKHCPAGVCPELSRYYIDAKECRACGLCARICPVEAIYEVENERVYRIDPEKCVDCGQCQEECPFEAIEGGRKRKKVAGV
ncbi:MAG: NADH-quinone oxidoreductase subunit NuoF [Firmicutes bacterium]|nr:NADH-quinone oxidoreductase subunit NuoF [Bacillota bacterium]